MLNYNYLLTSSLGLERLVKKEVQKQDFHIIQVQDKAIYFQGGIEAIARMNLWSRFGNILYFIINTQKDVRDFDTYFDAIYSQNWKKYIPDKYKVIVKATSVKSDLGAISTLQSLAKKAIVKNRVGNGQLQEHTDIGIIEIRILLDNNTLRIMINTSGEGLHKRGYREMTGHAPLKENIAAALVVLSGWAFHEPLYDPFCGAGTLCIEALMIAKNIAPGMKRDFAFEKWSWVETSLLEREKHRAVSLQFDRKYTLYASDIRKDVIQSAKRSASFAGLGSEIHFSCQDYREVLRKTTTGYIVSNPPYGLRLYEDDVEGIHRDLADFFSHHDIFGGIITSYPNFETYSRAKFKKRKLYNGGELCYFYKKI